MNIIDVIYSFLPGKHKTTPSGWVKFNAVCCHHNGTSVDTRQRAGFIRNADGVSYHCFNCGYKTSYIIGRHLTRKMRNLLLWLGASDTIVTKLAFEALKVESDQKAIEAISLPVFPDKNLPNNSIPLIEAIVNYPRAIDVAEYIMSRGFEVENYPWYWTPDLSDRIIIPFVYENRLVGWTARKITDGRPKYLSEQTAGFVFNLDAQTAERKFLIVAEGPLDAISIDGIAILGAEIMDKQAMLINRLNKQVILVPDRDPSGHRPIEQAIDLGWAVSMPNWEPGIKDINDAVQRYGKLYTLYSIITQAETTELKIRLKMKKWR